MLRLRFDEPLPPRIATRGEQFNICLSVVNERGILPYRIPNKGVPIKVGLINSHFQPVSDTHRIEADPKQPVIDATGKSNFLVTITAKDKADVCAASVPLQIVFETKFQVQFDESSAHHQGGNHHQQQQQQNQQAASSAKKAGGKATSSASQAASKAGASTELLELNVVSQSITCIKPGSKEPEFGHLPPTPDDCVKTVYKVLGQKVLCCEGQQLVDDIMPGLAHTVWDAGILLSLYIEHELARRPGGLRGSRVIELGAGPGLAGSVAAVAGAHVTLTDLAPAIHLIGGMNVSANMPAVTASRSGGGMEAVELAWGDTVIEGHQKLDPRLAGRWDYILGSDIVFNEELFEPLISSLLDLTQNVPGKTSKVGGRKSSKGAGKTQVLLTYRERERCARHGCHWQDFFSELGKHFELTQVKLEGPAAEFARNSTKMTEKSRQNLAMIIATRKTESPA